MTRERLTGKYIKLDFSENLALSLFEVQDAYFSGKQYSLHCLIVEPGENKYDINHDSIFVRFEVCKFLKF